MHFTKCLQSGHCTLRELLSCSKFPLLAWKALYWKIPRSYKKNFFLKGYNKSLPIVTDSIHTSLPNTRSTLRSAGSLPEGMVPSGNGDRDDISLYGTPKEEIGVTFEDANGSRPGWVRNQLQNIFQPTDNKLAMKLFGSKKALIQERVRQKAAGHWIIHPCSKFRYVKSSSIII